MIRDNPGGLMQFFENEFWIKDPNFVYSMFMLMAALHSLLID